MGLGALLMLTILAVIIAVIASILRRQRKDSEYTLKSSNLLMMFIIAQLVGDCLFKSSIRFAIVHVIAAV